MKKKASLSPIRELDVSNRPSWDEYFMELAHVVRKRSTCIRRHVGAVLVKDKRILATGYNGAPSGLPHCRETGCLRQRLNIPSGERHEICRGAHAEQNAIAQAALLGVSTKDSEIYITDHPCSVCAKILINAGVKRIVYEGNYPDKLAAELLAQSSIKVEKFTPKSEKGGGKK
ncbi:cytidine/deoxycytidylate deaminase family protein [Candidatus Sumerlaeota bacterium]|nr:cytidine/deoxycytidylate deaminase family protein [Candidatus Sumerlaeota bacterium]